MSAATLLVILVVGLIAGWLAGQIVKGTGLGLVADIAIGIVGALIGSWLLPRLGIHLGSGIVPAIIGATIGRLFFCLSSGWFTGEGGGDCLATMRCTMTKRNGLRWCRPEAAPDQEKRVTVVSAFTPVNKAATPHWLG
jgi:uncharacterized membrane protein YeaQ/YmgE (transglycosylase-associated protein family)